MHLLPFGQHRYILDTTPKKKKLEDRALKTRYLRATSQTQYLLFLPENGTRRLVRSCEFLLEAQMSERNLQEHQKAHEVAAAYDPFCDCVMHPSNKEMREKIVGGARRLPGNSKLAPSQSTPTNSSSLSRTTMIKPHRSSLGNQKR